jgi:hypothetical protein
VNKGLIGSLLAIIIVIGGTGYYWLERQKTIEIKEAARQAEITRVKNLPPVFDLSAKDAGALALQNIDISKIPEGKTLISAEYFSLKVKVENGKDVGGLLRKFYSKPTALIIMTVQNARNRKSQVSTPVLILKNSPQKPNSNEVLYAANDQVLPFEPSRSDGAADIAFDIHYLDEKMSREDISNLVRFAKNTAQHQNDLDTLLKKHRVKFYDNLMQLHVGPEQKIMSGRKIKIKGSTANIELTVLTKPMRFARQNSAAATIVKTNEINQLLQHASAKSKELQVNFWLNEGDGFGATCRELSNVLSDEAGLSIGDTSLVLWTLIHRHAWFAKDINYQTDCLNEAQSAALLKLKLTLPVKPKLRQQSPSNSAMNTILAQLVKVLQSGEPELTKVNLSAMIAEQVTLLDRADIWLFGDNIKQSVGGRILDSADQQATIDQLFTLPVSHFGCFSRGEGLKGRHRKTLAQFGASSEVWELEFAFNSKGKITGVTLDEANTETICRAIGERRSGNNACYFSRNAKQFPIVSNAKCG